MHLCAAKYQLPHGHLSSGWCVWQCVFTEKSSAYLYGSELTDQIIQEIVSVWSGWHCFLLCWVRTHHSAVFFLSLPSAGCLLSAADRTALNISTQNWSVGNCLISIISFNMPGAFCSFCVCLRNSSCCRMIYSPFFLVFHWNKMVPRLHMGLSSPNNAHYTCL